jgi:MerR family transcriptional regulator, light-induced transcriptional regulator
MTQDDLMNSRPYRSGNSTGASALAESAMSMLSQRQTLNPSGTRQFVIDHIVRAVCGRSSFDAGQMLDELRGHRLAVDAVIDIYVPTVARLLGEMWKQDEIDFATVTVGTMRLQSLLSTASVESLDFIRSVDDALSMLIVLPLGEDHSLGVFVLAAQLRRLGARVDISFCEPTSELVSRYLCSSADMVLFSASGRGTLESVSRIVLDFSRVSSDIPALVVGGCLSESDDTAKDISGVDFVTKDARQVIKIASGLRRTAPERKRA